MTQTIPNEVIDVLRDSRIEGGKLFLPSNLSRDLYVKTNKTLEILGGKWNRKEKAHVFAGDCSEIIERATNDGEVFDSKKTFQFFETPLVVAQEMVRRADLNPGDRILEPSAGKGAILEAIPERESYEITAMELNPENTKLKGLASKVLYGNFLTATPNDLGVFDKILANPPFRNGQDIAHVRHMFNFLKPKGRIVAITSPGWTFREDKKHVEFRDWLNSLGGSYDYEELPEGSFRESGTNVITIMLTIWR